MQNLAKKSFSWSKNIFLQKPGSSGIRHVTMVPGQGIGDAVDQVFKNLHVPIEFDYINHFDYENQSHMQKLQLRNDLKKNEQIICGVLGVNMKERMTIYKQEYNFRQLGQFCQVILAKSVKTPGFSSRHQNVDIAVFREITEGEYSGIEHEVYPGVIESIKVTTKKASKKVAKYAFEFAFLSGRKKVTAVHKANIMKICDGLFLEACREVAADFPSIQYEEMIIDNCTMQLVKTPQQFDVMVMPNLYGTIVNNTCSGITGGLAMTPGFDIGENFQCFRQGNRHLALDIVGKNIANPSAQLLSAIMMLRMQNLPKFADIIEFGLKSTIDDKYFLTKDLGGNCGTQMFVNQVIENSLKYKE